MLQPEYFNDKSDELIEIYNGLETFIIRDIAERILKSGEIAGTTDREIWKLEQMGLSKQKILKEISRLTGMTEKSVQLLLQDAILTSWEDEKLVYDALGIVTESPLENAMVVSVMDAEWKKVRGELSNLTMTTMNQAQSDLIRLLNEVDFRVASGMQSYSSAVCEVLDRYGQTGTMVQYPTGSRRSLEAAVRCAVVTSMNQTAAQVSNQYIAQNKIEYVWVSEHLGARYDKNHPTGLESHVYWQGKAYKIEGSEEGFPNLLESTGYTIDTTTGEGTVVNPLGLHGYNCRHTHGAWAKELGTIKQKIDQEESKKMYDLQQKQRAMERAIRQTKKQLMVKEMETKAYPDDINLQMEYQDLAKRYARQNEQYNQFCADNKLQTQSERLKVVGFGRSEAAKAIASTKTKEDFTMFEHYEKVVGNGDLSPLVSYEQYQRMSEIIDTNLMGIKTSNGIEIKGKSLHFIDRVFGSVEKKRDGVYIENIHAALTSKDAKVLPIRTKQGVKSQKFCYNGIEVSINPDTGVLIQCNPNTKRK